MFFAINHFYFVVAGVIALCIIYILIVGLFIPFIKQSKVKKHLIKVYADRKITLSKTPYINYVVDIEGVLHFYFVVDCKNNCDIVINPDKNITMYYQNVLKETKAKIIETNSIFSLNQKNKYIVFTNNVKSIKLRLNEKESKEVLENQMVNDTKFANLNQIKGETI